LTLPPPTPTTLPEDDDLSLIPLQDEMTSPHYAPPAQVNRDRGGCRGCLYVVGGGCGLIALLVIAVIALTIILPTAAVSGLLNGIGQALGVEAPPVASITSTQSIVTGIEPLGQLVSVSVQLAQADVQVSISQGFAGSCGYTANHVAQGAIEAGVDLTGIDADDLIFDEARDVYVLTIPAPELTSCRVDYIRQYEVNGTLCAVDADEARLLANYVSLIGFRNTALEGGILARAENETRIILSNFVRALTGANVEVVFEIPALSTAEPTDEPYTASCAPVAPLGWYQNERGEWLKN